MKIDQKTLSISLLSSQEDLSEKNSKGWKICVFTKKKTADLHD